MSPLMRMATGRAEHERVQMRAWRRCRPGTLALQDFDGRCCPGAPGVASVGGGDADRGEAEPFTAKRSGTG